ncbi:MAG: hypothetical protein GVY02_05435 [Bacteroidetes bacterium]|jgi:hypothetical protein|nr:hypothetical protein [Bacteroidota bacterium]
MESEKTSLEVENSKEWIKPELKVLDISDTKFGDIGNDDAESNGEFFNEIS